MQPVLPCRCREVQAIELRAPLSVTASRGLLKLVPSFECAKMANHCCAGGAMSSGHIAMGFSNTSIIARAPDPPHTIASDTPQSPQQCRHVACCGSRSTSMFPRAGA